MNRNIWTDFEFEGSVFHLLMEIIDQWNSFSDCFYHTGRNDLYIDSTERSLLGLDYYNESSVTWISDTNIQTKQLLFRGIQGIGRDSVILVAIQVVRFV